MGDGKDEKEKVRHRVRMHMVKALTAGAVGSIVLGSTIAGCQSQSTVPSQSQDQDLRNRTPPMVCDPLPPPRRSLKTTIQFDFAKATLKAHGEAKLDEIIAQLKQVSLEAAVVIGHADRIGTDAVNQKLSEQRAEAVKTYLISKGLNSKLIYIEGKGSESPATKPDECKGLEKNKVINCLQPDRRVDIEILTIGRR